MIKIILYSLVSGITIIIGGSLASIDRFPDSELKRSVLHGIVAFGGGVLIAAVAFVLVPQGIKLLSLANLIIIFLLGTSAFFLLDRYIGMKGGTAAQVMAMLMDFIPEAIALGGVFAHDPRLGLLLAIFIGMQNLPEGFNAFGDLIKSGFSVKKSLLILTPLSFIGIVAAVSGSLFLSGYPRLIASVMVFAGGGIVYLTFQDIAPLAKLEKHWSPALGASLGFMVGMIGQKILG